MYYKFQFCDKCGKIFLGPSCYTIVAYNGEKEDGTMHYCYECYSDICKILNMYHFDVIKEIDNFIDAYNKRENK